MQDRQRETSNNFYLPCVKMAEQGLGEIKKASNVVKRQRSGSCRVS